MNLRAKYIHKTILFLLPGILLLLLAGKKDFYKGDIVLENNGVRLVVGENGIIRSLFLKTKEEECLQQDVEVPFSGIVQDYPYDNENKLAFPAKRRMFPVNKVRKSGNDLILNFERTDYEATIGVTITESYIVFTLKKLDYKKSAVGDKRKTRIDEFILFQIPVKERKHFGEWLNVVWDERVAVNLLAVNPVCRIDAYNRPGYKIFQAAGEREVQLEGISAALIVTTKEDLLNRIDVLEHAYNMPLGVASRKCKAYKSSYYEMKGVTPENIDRHIAYAKKGGFKQMVVYYMDFARSMGHFGWKEEFPGGMRDLEKIVQKIKDAGMLPGFHIHYNKAQITDPYVTPVPDPRLNIRRYFSLREDLDKGTTTIVVEENPKGCTLEKGRRILRVGTELIAYESYTTTIPYKFLNCTRGYLNTKPVSRSKGDILGLMDVDTWPVFIRFNQNTNIQQEVADRLEKIIDGVGFRFLYYDGAEDVPAPYWYNVSKAQLAVYNPLSTRQLFAEGAQKSHYSWHILTRGNAFDDFPPELFKEGIRRYPLEEARMIANDFTSIDFGWINPLAPDSNTIGMQPDMIEYAESKSAGWNSVISLVGDLKELDHNPRTADNLEVIKRWEEFKVSGLLTDEQKKELQDPKKEHLLLLNEKGEYELVRDKQIMIPDEKMLRAFLFRHNGGVWVVCWHTCGKGVLKLSVPAGKVHLYENLGQELPVITSKQGAELPVDKRRYLRFDLPEKRVIELMKGSVLYE